MFKKGNLLYSVFKMKCPECHEGEFFSSRIYDLKNMGEMHEKCPECGCKYSKEPGFYYGAMYVSYGLGVALMVAAFLLTYILFPGASTVVYITVLLLAMIICAPYLYSLSKIIWANMFFKYQGKNKK